MTISWLRTPVDHPQTKTQSNMRLTKTLGRAGRPGIKWTFQKKQPISLASEPFAVKMLRKY